MNAGETHRAIEAIFRIDQARLAAGLARVLRDVRLAKELAQDALVTAPSESPRTGVSASPGAWPMAVAQTARHRRPSARKEARAQAR